MERDLGSTRSKFCVCYSFGSLQRIELKCSGNTSEAVLDRFPTAEITGSDPEDGACIVSAEVYGPGYDMWLNGQKGVELIRKTELPSRVL